ncbi:MAG: pyrroline-5-carboxylate reductase [Pseudomonadota bacterium]
MSGSALPLAGLTIALIGAGRMGGAMLEGWLKAGLTPERTVIVDPRPSPAVEALLEGHIVSRTLEGTAPDIVVLAVKPQVMDAVLTPLADAIPQGALIVSVAAGRSAASIASALGGRPIVRVMPNTPALIGRGIAGLWANAMVDESGRARAETLLASVGETVWVQAEADIDAVTAVSGSGPAYVFHLVEAMAAAGEAAGLPPETAMRLARATVSGAGALLDASPDEAATLRANVTSPGGTTAAALDILMAPDGLPALMEKAVAAAKARSEALGG